MDHASFHKKEEIEKVIENKEIIFEYLPPYRPDLNPIEKKWAPAKLLRRSLRCDVESLFKYHF